MDGDENCQRLIGLYKTLARSKGWPVLKATFLLVKDCALKIYEGKRDSVNVYCDEDSDADSEHGNDVVKDKRFDFDVVNR